ncbi:MAG: restriction endonuclease subunit S [Sedimentibacter sp.]
MGTTLNKATLINLRICIPPIEEQKKIAEILDKASNLISLRKQQIEKLDLLVKSRFVEMFVRPKDKKFERKTLPDIISDNKNSLKRGPFGGSLKKENFVREGYLVYEQRHAIHNDFEYAKYFITEEKYKEMIIFKVEPHDLLVSCSGVTLGRIAEVPDGAREGIINQALLKITLNQSLMNNTYFIYLFRDEQIQDILFGFSRGSGIPNFPSMSEVKAVKFICPPIELQNQFADFVQQVENQKLEMQVGLEKLEQNYKALMQQYFG